MAQATNTDHCSDLEEIVQQQETILNGSHEELIDCIRTMKDQLNSIVGKVEEEKVNTADLYTKTKEHLDAVRDTIHTQDSRAEDSEKEQTVLQDRVSELTEQNDGYQSRIDTLTQALAEQEQRCSTMETELTDRNESSEEIADAQAQIDELKTQLAEATTKIGDSEKVLRRVEKLEKALTEQAEVVEAGQAAKRKLAELEVAAKGFKKASKDEKKKAEKLATQLSELEGQLTDSAAVQHKLDESESNQEKLNDRVDTLTKENESLQGEVSTLLSDLQVAKEEATESHATLEKVETHLSELRETNESHENALEKNSFENEKLQEKVHQLEDEKNDLSGKEAERNELVSTLKEENESLRVSIAELETLPEKVGDLERSLVAAEQRSSDLARELDDERAQGTKSVLAEQLSLALKDKEQSKTEIQELHSKIENLTSRLNEKTVAPVPTAEVVEVEDSEPVETVSKDEGGDTCSTPAFKISEEKLHLGYLLLESGVVSQEQLDEVIRCQQEERSTERIGQLFVTMGYATEEVVAQALAHQIKGRFVRLDEYPVKKEAVNLISDRLAEMHGCIPLAIEDDHLVVAMSNPLDLIAIEDLERATEFNVEPVVATASDIRQLAKEYYYS